MANETMVDFRELLVEMRGDIELALKEVGEAHDVVFSVGSCKYDAGTATFKLNVARVVKGKVVDKAAEDFKRMATLYGFAASDLDRSFVSRGVVYRVAGLYPRRHKRPVSAVRQHDGKRFVFPAEAVKAGLR